MPRLPGRESTQKVIALEHALISSFVFPWEQTTKCCIKGCEHPANGLIGSLVDGTLCSNINAGYIIDARNEDRFIGIACPHCVDEILRLGDQEPDPALGNPEGSGA